MPKIIRLLEMFEQLVKLRESKDAIIITSENELESLKKQLQTKTLTEAQVIIYLYLYSLTFIAQNNLGSLSLCLLFYTDRNNAILFFTFSLSCKMPFFIFFFGEKPIGLHSPCFASAIFQIIEKQPTPNSFFILEEARATTPYPCLRELVFFVLRCVVRVMRSVVQ